LVDGASPGGDSHLALRLHVCCALGFLAQRLARTLHSLVRVSRRGVQEHFDCVTSVRHPREGGKCTNAPRSCPGSAWGRPHCCASPPARCPRRTHAVCHGACKAPAFPQKPTRARHTALERLPFKQFQVLFTAISSFFSSFPHGTCSLSVSRPYLALEGIYLPLRAAIPNYSTLEERPVRGAGERETGLSPSAALLSSRL
jgi:hypothetical protein